MQTQKNFLVKNIKIKKGRENKKPIELIILIYVIKYNIIILAKAEKSIQVILDFKIIKRHKLIILGGQILVSMPKFQFIEKCIL